MLEEETKMKSIQLKSKQQQYLDQARQTLNCTAITKSVDLEYIETDDSGETRTFTGSAMRKRNGVFRVSLEDDLEFQVKEENLLNEAVYKIKEK